MEENKCRYGACKRRAAKNVVHYAAFVFAGPRSVKLISTCKPHSAAIFALQKMRAANGIRNGIRPGSMVGKPPLSSLSGVQTFRFTHRSDSESVDSDIERVLPKTTTHPVLKKEDNLAAKTPPKIKEQPKSTIETPPPNVRKSRRIVQVEVQPQAAEKSDEPETSGNSEKVEKTKRVEHNGPSEERSRSQPTRSSQVSQQSTVQKSATRTEAKLKEKQGIEKSKSRRTKRVRRGREPTSPSESPSQTKTLGKRKTRTKQTASSFPRRMKQLSSSGSSESSSCSSSASEYEPSDGDGPPRSPTASPLVPAGSPLPPRSPSPLPTSRAAQSSTRSSHEQSRIFHQQTGVAAQPANASIVPANVMQPISYMVNSPNVHQVPVYLPMQQRASPTAITNQQFFATNNMTMTNGPMQLASFQIPANGTALTLIAQMPTANYSYMVQRRADSPVQMAVPNPFYVTPPPHAPPQSAHVAETEPSRRRQPIIIPDTQLGEEMAVPEGYKNFQVFTDKAAGQRRVMNMIAPDTMTMGELLQSIPEGFVNFVAAGSSNPVSPKPAENTDDAGFPLPTPPRQPVTVPTYEPPPRTQYMEVEELEEDHDPGPYRVNPRQYARIMKRRATRMDLILAGKIPSCRQKYLHESRHRHALARIRGEGGKFDKGPRQNRHQSAEEEGDGDVEGEGDDDEDEEEEDEDEDEENEEPEDDDLEEVEYDENEVDDESDEDTSRLCDVSFVDVAPGPFRLNEYFVMPSEGFIDLSKMPTLQVVPQDPSQEMSSTNQNFQIVTVDENAMMVTSNKVQPYQVNDDEMQYVSLQNGSASNYELEHAHMQEPVVREYNMDEL